MPVGEPVDFLASNRYSALTFAAANETFCQRVPRI
jgi:hypothetical protein